MILILQINLMGRAQVTIVFPLHVYFSLNFRFHTVSLKIQYKPLLSLAAPKLGQSVTMGIFILSVLVTESKLLNFTGIFDLAY